MRTKMFFQIMMLLLIASVSFAQTAFVQNLNLTKDKGAYHYYTEAVINGVDTLTTNVIDLSDGIYNIPIYGRKLFTSTAAKPKIKIVRQEDLFGTWTDVKTYYTADSVETAQSMPGDTLRAVRSRYLIIGATGNATDTRVKFSHRFLKLP